MPSLPDADAQHPHPPVPPSSSSPIYNAVTQIFNFEKNPVVLARLKIIIHVIITSRHADFCKTKIEGGDPIPISILYEH